jgi:hypothetical protein
MKEDLIGHGIIAHLRVRRSAYKVSIGKLVEKRPLRRPRHMWEVHIKNVIMK